MKVSQQTLEQPRSADAQPGLLPSYLVPWLWLPPVTGYQGWRRESLKSFKSFHRQREWVMGHAQAHLSSKRGGWPERRFPDSCPGTFYLQFVSFQRMCERACGTFINISKNFKLKLRTQIVYIQEKTEFTHQLFEIIKLRILI